jgi:putative intracellular protease/amidase
MNMKTVMVLTSHDQLRNTGRKTGFWLEEFAAPYFVFRDAGVQLTLASPKGGQPPIDPKSDEPENQTDAMTRFKKDPAAQQALAQTIRLPDVKSEELKRIGGLYEKAADWAPFSIIDGRMVTGQNPASSTSAARDLLSVLNSREVA